MKTKALVTISILILTVLTLIAPLCYAKNEASRPFKVVMKASGQATPLSATLLEIVITGSGQATHMGKSSVWQHHVVDLTSMTFFDGEYILTAANGDTVEGSYYGYLVPTSVGFEIHGLFTVDGGTGRFADASGGGSALGIQYFDNTAELGLYGTIAY
jgi:hypothetical protein